MIKDMRPLKVFLCHASDDKLVVEKFYDHLINDGVDVWLDKKNLFPGQDWQLEIYKAVRNSDVVIVFLSSKSITKEGYIQKEIKITLDVADEKPEGTIFIIPARLEKCKVPERFAKFQWVDLFEDNGYEQILKALQIQTNHLREVVDKNEPENLVLNYNDLMNLADLLIISGKAQQLSRKSLCIQIGLDSTNLSSINLPTEKDFAFELVFHLSTTRNYNSMLRMCNVIKPTLGDSLVEKLKILDSKLQRIQSNEVHH